MKVSQIMQAKVTTATPDTSVRAAAALMEACDIGILAVCENGRLTGVVTDRDIVVRLMSKTGAGTDIPLGDIMSQPVLGCRENDDVADVAAIMGDHQIRRLVVRGGNGQLAGIVSLADIARDASELLAGEALGEIVERR